MFYSVVEVSVYCDLFLRVLVNSDPAIGTNSLVNQGGGVRGNHDSFVLDDRFMSLSEAILRNSRIYRRLYHRFRFPRSSFKGGHCRSLGDTLQPTGQSFGVSNLSSVVREIQKC